MTSVPGPGQGRNDLGPGGSHAVGDTGGSGARHGSISDAIPPADQVEGAHQTFDKGEVSSLGAIVSDISNDLSTLMRQELALAKAEAQQTASRAGKGAGMLAGAGVAGHMTLVFLSLALMWALDAALDSLVWASVIVMLLWAAIAAILAVMGRSQLKRAPGMDRTVDTAKRVPDALKGNEG
jgi:putative superfamily III holin-X